MARLGNLGRAAAMSLSLLSAVCSNYVDGTTTDVFNYRDADGMPDLNSADDAPKDGSGGNTDVEVIGHDVGDAAIEASDTGSDATPEVAPDVTYDADTTKPADATPDAVVDVTPDAKPADVTPDAVVDVTPDAKPADATPDAVTDNGGTPDANFSIVSLQAGLLNEAIFQALLEDQFPFVETLPPGTKKAFTIDAASFPMLKGIVMTGVTMVFENIGEATYKCDVFATQTGGQDPILLHTVTVKPGETITTGNSLQEVECIPKK